MNTKSTALPKRSAVKVNACLAMIHQAGHDPKAVQALAQAMIAKGEAPRMAYQNALNAFVSDKPEMMRDLTMTTRLIDASDAKTVEQYGAAFSAYSQSGDEAALAPILPTLAADMQVFSDRLSRGEQVREAPEDEPAEPAAPPQAPMGRDAVSNQEGASTRRGFAEERRHSAALAKPGSQPAATGQRPGAIVSPSGIRTGKAAERWERAERVTYGSSQPLARPSFTPQQSGEGI